MFDGTDARARAVAALEAARAVVAEGSNSGTDAPSSGRERRGQCRAGTGRLDACRSGRGSRWLYAVEGEPVEHAPALVRSAAPVGVLVTSEVGRLVSEQFRLRPAGEGAYRVLAAIEPDEGAAARLSSTRRVTTVLVTDIVGSGHPASA